MGALFLRGFQMNSTQRRKDNMLIESQNEPFACLKNFCNLRCRSIVVAGNNADARMANFLFKSTTAHNRYKAGYIEFENRKRFDLANQTIRAERVFLFLAIPEIDILWRRQTLEYKIKDCVDKMAPRDKLAAEQLVQQHADPGVHDRRFMRYRFPQALRALSVPQLEALAKLFAMPCDDQRAGASLAAA
jgi:hypothetical protein